MKTHLAVYLHPQTCQASKPLDQIKFVGQSYSYLNQLRTDLEKALANYPTLALRKADYNDYLRVHTDTYIHKIKGKAAGEHLKEPPRLSIECSGLVHCMPGYLYGLGGMLEAIDQMRRKGLERAYCFSLGGHHAYAERGHGYCLLNPMAAAARYAQKQGFKKVLIVDWDIHHGDGTQSIFAHDPDVYCISIHSGLDIYMASARVLHDGTTTAGQAVGHCNIPLQNDFFDEAVLDELGLSGDFYSADESLHRFRSALDHIPWTPDIIMIFSGYDSHKADEGEGITNWTRNEFKTLTEYVTATATRANSPILSVHGGGYNAKAAVRCAVSHIEALAR